MSGRITSLDGLRLICCAMVVAGHACWTPITGRMASLGVDIFFALSGFVITRGLLQEHATRGEVSLAGFYRRRIRRIFPVYYAALAVAFGLTWVLRVGLDRAPPGWPAVQPSTALMYALFLGNVCGDHVVSSLEILWSVCVEEQFYLAFPLALSLRRRRLPVVAVAVVGLLLAWATRVWLAARGEFNLFRNPLAHADGLLGGALLAQLAASRPALLRRFSGARVELLAVAAACVHVIFRWSSPSPLSFWVSFLLSALVSVAIVAALLPGTGPLARLLAARPLAWLGGLTYEGYVAHMYAVMMAWGLARWLQLGAAEIPVRIALALALTFALAWPLQRAIARGMSAARRRP
jgi:peptidoglycan/LPS O-acetylase OafA/YrhL